MRRQHRVEPHAIPGMHEDMRWVKVLAVEAMAFHLKNMVWTPVSRRRRATVSRMHRLLVQLAFLSRVLDARGDVLRRTMVVACGGAGQASGPAGDGSSSDGLGGTDPPGATGAAMVIVTRGAGLPGFIAVQEDASADGPGVLHPPAATGAADAE